MERKIGEIFEYNGEWYQCVVGCHCGYCAFCNNNCEERERITLGNKLTKEETTGFCTPEFREDGKSVIFKKLEKVGEPYMDGGKIMQKYKRVYREPIYFPYKELNCYNDLHGRICIEIKQNQEDMEENKLNLKPFDIQKAREGKLVCTRDGRKTRIICFNKADERPIVALISDNGSEFVYEYLIDGRCYKSKDDSNDLMMLPEKKEGWAKVRKDINLYNTKEEADRKMIGNDEYVTAKVFWEE